MHKIGWVFVFALGMTFCRLPAAAQSISYSQTLEEGVGGFGGFQQGDVMGSNLQSFSLPQFSPTLGNLNSVELTFSTTTTVDVNFYTTAIGDPAPDFVVPDGSYSFQADYFLTEYDAASNNILELDLSQTLSGGAQGSVAYVFQLHTYFQYTATASGDNATSQQILPSDPNFATYLGSGNLNFDLNFVYDIGQSGYSDPDFQPFIISLTSSDSQSLVTINYDYSPLAVPEPSSLALLAGLCLVGASHLSRRRRAKQSP